MDTKARASLGLDRAGRTEVLPSGTPTCVWQDGARTQEIASAAYASRDLLVDAYRSRDINQVFRPVVVSDFPAAVQQTTAGGYSCTITTGVALGQALDVTVTELLAEAPPMGPCATAETVSTLIVRNVAS